MREFEKSLKAGEFRIPECTICGAVVWPPSEICNECFGDVRLRPHTKGDKLVGLVVECSVKTASVGDDNNELFCLVEFESGSIHLMAKVVGCELKDRGSSGDTDPSWYDHTSCTGATKLGELCRPGDLVKFVGCDIRNGVYTFEVSVIGTRKFTDY